MDFFRQWLLGVIACAMVVSAAEQLCPEGSVRALTRFTGALLLLLAMLRPLSTAEFADITRNTLGYREAVARLELELGVTGENALSDGIASELEAYIGDKAESLGVRVRPEVTMERRGGAPVPQRVTLYGPYSEALSELIASELGVAKEKQLWIKES